MEVVSWELKGEKWEVDVGVTQSKPGYPSNASTTVVCENFGAFELSGGKTEIVAIILRLTSDRQTLVAQNFRCTYLGHF